MDQDEAGRPSFFTWLAVACCALTGLAWLDWHMGIGLMSGNFGVSPIFFALTPVGVIITSLIALIRREMRWRLALACLLGALVYFPFLVWLFLRMEGGGGMPFFTQSG